LMNPFDADPQCLPLLPALKSRKCKVFARGTLSTGTAGFGFVLGMGNPARNSTSGTYSDSSYAGTTFDDSSLTVGVNNYFNNSDYVTADFGGNAEDIQARQTALGLRVRYRGTVLNRNGTVLAIEEPNHANLDSLNENAIKSFDRVKIVPVPASEWVTVVYQPVRVNDYNYEIGSYFGYDVLRPYLGIAVIADPTVPVTMEFEYFCHYEAIGSPVRAKTSSHVNVVDTSNLIANFAQQPTTTIDKASQSLAAATNFVDNVGKFAYKTYGMYQLGASMANTALAIL